MSKTGVFHQRLPEIRSTQYLSIMTTWHATARKDIGTNHHPNTVLRFIAAFLDTVNEELQYPETIGH